MSKILQKRTEKRKKFWNILGLFFLASAIFFLSLEFVYSKSQDIKIWGTGKGLIIKTQNNNLITFGEISKNKIKIFKGNFLSYFNNTTDITKLKNLEINQQVKTSEINIIKLSSTLFMGKIKNKKFFFITKDFKKFPYNLPIKTESNFWILESYNTNILNLPLPENAIFILSNKKSTKKFQKIKTPIINTKKNWILEFKENLKFSVEK